MGSKFLFRQFFADQKYQMGETSVLGLLMGFYEHNM